MKTQEYMCEERDQKHANLVYMPIWYIVKERNETMEKTRLSQDRGIGSGSPMIAQVLFSYLFYFNFIMSG